MLKDNAKARSLTIGTRGSALAQTQAREVRQRLMRAHGLPQEAFSIEIITTSGDRIQDRPLAEAGGKGLFTKEIEEALLAGRIDIAVHSSKDMPSLLPEGLDLIGFLEREDPRDAFIGGSAGTLAELRRGATIGSSSLRRQALVRRHRPDIVVVPFRGNVQTRLAKLDAGTVDATLLATAGLRRLGVESRITEMLDIEIFVPAPGQGAICVEARRDDRRAADLVAAIHHAPTGWALACERAFLTSLDGSCRTPIGGYARIEGDRIDFHGLVLSPDGGEAHEISAKGAAADAGLIGARCGSDIRDKAGTRFFEGWG